MEIKIASNIKELREQNNMKQSDLALALHTTQRKISYWECGMVEPDLENLWKLSDLFHVSVDFLIGKENY